MNPGMDITWDVRLTKGTRDMLRVNLPSELSRAMINQGYNRVAIMVGDAGILLKPYVSGSGDAESPQQYLPLPKAWAEDA